MLYRISLLLVWLACTTIVQLGRADEPPVFEVEIAPLLVEKCGKCHSEKVRRGGLDLSSFAALTRGGESGASLLAESLDDSLLWIMVADGDMPPPGQPPLTDPQRDLIRRWLEAGAPAAQPRYAEHRELNQHDVLPIVLLRCVTCHGARLQRGGLDLRSRAAMLAGGANGPALVPGDPDSSLLMQRIESEACPPRELLLRFFIKRPPASEIETLRAWIAAGAPEVDVAADVATAEADPLVTDEDRRHWAFQPPIANREASSIDDFIRARLNEQGLDFAPEADRDTLIRRAYLDLIGMPPNLDELRRWQSSAATDWYAQMIDHLLASPHYGERWGRYWLDLAGYADSEGGVSSDPLRSVAWKYRDYVIDAFNNDKPYDRFLVEQLAGDELLDYEHAPVVTPEMVDNLVATGFLRMGIDQTGSRTMNFVPERLGVINDALTIVGEGLLGLTIGCARCHSHKYDPLPQRDYYRFKAIFQGALDEHDWLTFRNRSLDVAVPERRQRAAEVNPPLAARLKKREADLQKAINQLQLTLLREHYPEQSESDRQDTLKALRVADNTRTRTQRLLVEMLQRVELLPDEAQPEPVLAAQSNVATIQSEVAELKRQMEPPLAIRALWDRGEPSPTYLLRRGEHDQPGQLVGPGVPSVLTDGRTPFVAEPPFPNGTPKTGRRLALARWLTQPDHPLTARVMVNRVWHHHFGAGIVRSLENFGLKGEPPSHPELLDWLAVQFVESGWSIKQLHRTMMNSRTYRQSSRVTDERWRIDPPNRWLSRMPLRRMDAETLRDSLLSVAGQWDDTRGGPPDPVTVDRDGLVTVDPTEQGRWRRSIYVQHRRTEMPTMLEAFDYPEMGPNCQVRGVSTVSPQALILMHNERVRTLAAALAARVEAELADRELRDDELADDDPNDWTARVDLVYQLALSRLPTDDERQLAVQALESFESAWQGERDAALETYCHTMLNSAAFLYVD